MQFQETNKVADTTAKQEGFFENCYLQTFPKVAAFVSGRGGSFEDAKDVFQDALVIFCEQRRSGRLTIRSSEEAYIVGVARHLWYRKFDKDRMVVSLSSDEYGIGAEQAVDVNTLSLLQLLEGAGKKCMNLLHAFYYEKVPLAMISRTLGYGSERSATVQKYKCLEKIRDTVKAKSISYAEFID